MEGLTFSLILTLSMFSCFAYFYVARKDDRIPIFTLLVVAAFWVHFGANIGPSLEGTLFYIIKAVTDFATAVLFMLLHAKYDKKNEFQLCRFLAWLFWANAGINLISAGEFNTQYSYMDRMYIPLVTLLNVAQVLILFKGVQDYVSKHSGTTFNTKRNAGNNVGIPDSLDLGAKKSKTKK